jgi:hypothetical protein
VVPAAGVTITRVQFFRNVLGAASVELGTVTAAPWRIGFTVNTLDVNTPVAVMASVTLSTGVVVEATFTGRVREKNSAPTNILISASSVLVCSDVVLHACAPMDVCGDVGGLCSSTCRKTVCPELLWVS